MKYKKTISGIGFLLIYTGLLFILFYAEKDSSSSSIHSFWDTVWYSVVTLSTVGYGDMTPGTDVGKIIGLFFVLGSVTILTALISTVTEFIAELRGRKKMGLNGTKFENHVVIIGLNSFVRHIIQTLLDANQKVAVIIDHKSEIDLLYERYGREKFFVLYSSLDDYTSFKKANIDKSKIVHPALSSDTEDLVMILNLKEYYKNLEFIVVLEEGNLKNTFRSAGVTHVLSKNEFASKFMASYIFEPAVADLTTDLISPNISEDNHEEFDIQQFIVNETNPYKGKTWGYFFDDIRKEFKSLPIGIKTAEGKLHKLPPDDLIIGVGDYIIFINNECASRKIARDVFKVEQGEYHL